MSSSNTKPSKRLEGKCFRCGEPATTKGYYEGGFEDGNPEFNKNKAQREINEHGETIYFEWFCPDHEDEIGEF
jgi:hypothetical protein